MKVIVFAGHGAIDPVTGEYHDRLGGRLFHHPDPVGTFYEGVENRKWAKVLVARLNQIKGVRCERGWMQFNDWESDRRSKYANAKKADLIIDVHSNQSPGHNARGFELLVPRENDPEADTSFALAKRIEAHLKRLIPEHKIRPTKRYNLEMNRDTQMVSLILEPDFYDTYEGAVWLRDENNILNTCESIALSVEEFLNEKSKEK